MAWMNVDRPTSKLTIHASANRWVRGMRATRRKGVRQVRPDGGWLPYASIAAALARGRARWANYRVTVCP